jgi:CRISPR-associated protein Csy2
MKTYLLIQHAKIHNANAMSSTFTIGVPAMTAWLGAVHALERKLKKHSELQNIQLPKVTVSFHKTDLQTFKASGKALQTIKGTANPLDKDAKRPPIVELPRIHLDVSLLIEVKGLDGDNDELLRSQCAHILPTMKLAGGDIVNIPGLKLLYGEDSDKKIIYSLMPGYVPIERPDLMAAGKGDDALNRLLEYLEIDHHADKDENNAVTGWTSKRKETGWLVPLAVGFKGLTPLGKVKNQRNPNTPHRFAEAVVTLSEFKMPCRFNSIDDMMWHYEFKERYNLYLCVNKKGEM